MALHERQQDVGAPILDPLEILLEIAVPHAAQSIRTLSTRTIREAKGGTHGPIQRADLQSVGHFIFRAAGAALRCRRAYTLHRAGAIVLQQGFRPFFFLCALWMAVSLGIWVAVLAGAMELRSAFSPRDWHIHELLFGYTSGVIAGFLLTAVPNWTGRPGLSGAPLAGLAGLWLAGRLAVFNAANLEPGVAAVIDLAFPVVLGVVLARELIAGNNSRNMRVLLVFVGLTAVNLLFHIEVYQNGTAGLSVRLGIAAVLPMIMLIGGRVIPSFTGTWLKQRPPGRLPAPFGRYDAITIAISAAALVVWTGAPEDSWTAALMLVAGGLNCGRLARWAGERSLAEPLVLVLHVGFAFIPLGFIAMAGSILLADPVPYGAAIHLWTAGGIGMMTIAMMTRVCLGHTGALLRADRWVTAIYLLVFTGIMTRVAAAFLPGNEALLQLSAAAWIGGFLLFAVWFLQRMAR
jgi:uncharacterized protein involved in response to NO